ncbi:MAG: hypothetical protein EG823_02225 [Actinobacteria bacterium]|nr:hypothetical protein [Actinomycetota bacterium]
MTYSESEIINLFLVLVLSPMLAVGLRELRFPGKVWSEIGFSAIALGLVVTVLEGFVFPDALNLVEHACYAAGGICGAVGAYLLAKDARRAYRGAERP